MFSSNLTPPERRSMTDAQIHEALGNARADEAGIVAAMELLEHQAQLRDIEKMEFSAWVLEMEQIGSSETLLAVENAKRAQQGLEPLVEIIEERAFEVDPGPIVESEVYLEPGPVVIAEVNVESTPVVEDEIYFESEIVLGPSSDSEPDAFERLLSADTVVGAEDELTAIEDSLNNFFDTNLTPTPAPVFETSGGSPIEQIKLESDPPAVRYRGAGSQFWAWLGISGSVLPLGLAWLVHSLGISFTQGVAAIFLGCLASAIVIAVGALAGKRSGLPTLLLSRAAFGVRGNVAPAFYINLMRLIWTGALFASLIALGAEFLGVGQITAVNEPGSVTLLIVSGAILAVAVLLAIFGGKVIYRSQQVAGVLGVLVVSVVIFATASSISLTDLLSQPSSSWLLSFGASVLTFSVFGLTWTSTGADFARKLAVSARGTAVVGWATLALAALPTAIAAYGLALFGSLETKNANPMTSPGYATQTFVGDFMSSVAPWLPVVVGISALITFAVVIAMSLYSSSLGFRSLGVNLPFGLALPLLGAVTLGLALAGLVYFEDFWSALSGYAIVASVPVAAWSGIFVTDVLIRRISYHEISLKRAYGFYKSVNWVNLSGWILASLVGFGLVYSALPGFEWTGYFANLMVNQEFWRTSNFGVVIALAIGALLPLLFGIPRIKRQEEEVLAIESRRDDLKDIFGLVD